MASWVEVIFSVMYPENESYETKTLTKSLVCYSETARKKIINRTMKKKQIVQQSSLKLTSKTENVCG